MTRDGKGAQRCALAYLGFQLTATKFARGFVELHRFV
jgi:hypothetical protein